MQIIMNKIKTKSGFTYIVTQSPDSYNLQIYKDFLLINCVNTVVKLCEGKEYDYDFLFRNGIKLIDVPICDGTIPSENIMIEWINIIKNEMKTKKGLAVHCVSGLGRAPLFVCIGLIKIDKMDPVDAITFVRKSIPRALNKNQINFLSTLSSNEKKEKCLIC